MIAQPAHAPKKSYDRDLCFYSLAMKGLTGGLLDNFPIQQKDRLFWKANISI